MKTTKGRRCCCAEVIRPEGAFAVAAFAVAQANDLQYEIVQIALDLPAGSVATGCNFIRVSGFLLFALCMRKRAQREATFPAVVLSSLEVCGCQIKWLKVTVAWFQQDAWIAASRRGDHRRVF